MHVNTTLLIAMLCIIIGLCATLQLGSTPINEGQTEGTLQYLGDFALYSITVPPNYKVVFTVTRPSQSVLMAAYAGDGFEPSSARNSASTEFYSTNPLNSNTLSIENDDSYAVTAYLRVESKQTASTNFELGTKLYKNSLVKEGTAIFLGVVIPVGCCCFYTIVATVAVLLYVRKKKKDQLMYANTPPTPVIAQYDQSILDLHPTTLSSHNMSVSPCCDVDRRDSGVPMIPRHLQFEMMEVDSISNYRPRSDSTSPLTNDMQA